MTPLRGTWLGILIALVPVLMTTVVAGSTWRTARVDEAAGFEAGISEASVSETGLSDEYRPSSPSTQPSNEQVTALGIPTTDDPPPRADDEPTAEAPAASSVDPSGERGDAEPVDAEDGAAPALDPLTSANLVTDPIGEETGEPAVRDRLAIAGESEPPEGADPGLDSRDRDKKKDKDRKDRKDNDRKDNDRKDKDRKDRKDKDRKDKDDQDRKDKDDQDRKDRKGKDRRDKDDKDRKDKDRKNKDKGGKSKDRTGSRKGGG
ncbi:MAG: hypothetical protein QNJ71_11345 [Acidimicrobiia bacterium]|nr:hypothetical protein [Acidimicrobiia bacterium]